MSDELAVRVYQILCNYERVSVWFIADLVGLSVSMDDLLNTLEHLSRYSLARSYLQGGGRWSSRVWAALGR